MGPEKKKIFVTIEMVAYIALWDSGIECSVVYCVF